MAIVLNRLSETVMSMNQMFTKFILAAAVLVVAGCAPSPSAAICRSALADIAVPVGCNSEPYAFVEEGAYDPIEPINRAVYGFNKKVDFFLLRPAAKQYSGMPVGARKTVNNFLNNLGEPKNIVNHILQKNGNDAARSGARLVFNSIFGLGGLFDWAGGRGIEHKPTGLGSTIRAYAGDNGAYLVLPLVGPSSLADAPGLAGDTAVWPPVYWKEGKWVGGLAAVKTRADFLEHENLIETALDEYAYVRDVREDLRRQQTPINVWGDPEDIWNQ